MLYILLKYTIGILILLVLRPVVFWRNNLKIKGKAIFVCNHISLFDPILIGLVSSRTVHFMAKAELFKPLIGRLFFKAMMAFPVNRNSVDLTSLKNALVVLDKGKVFGIFPEGRRCVADVLDEFERGAALLALRSGAPVIPMYIRPDSYRRLHPVMIVGKPIDISSIVAVASKTTLIDVVTDEIKDSINSLRLQLEELT